MQTAETLARTDYVLLEAAWTVEYALKVLRAAREPMVVIHREKDGEEYYYIYHRADIEVNSPRYAPTDLVETMLDLHEWRADRKAKPGQPLGGGPPAVVIDQGRLVGYVMPGGGTTRGGLESTRPRAADRRRTLRADFPASLAVGKTAELKVSLSRVAARTRGGGQSSEVQVAQPVGAELSVIVQPRRGLEVQGDAKGKLVVGSANEFEPLRFRLLAVEEGEADLRVIVFREGAVVAYLKLNPQVVAALGAAGGRERLNGAQGFTEVAVQAPDLSLHIEEQTGAGGQRGFVVYLSARNTALNLNEKKIGPTYFQSDPGPFFGEFYRGIEGLPLTSLQEMALAGKELEARGVFLFENLFPPDAQALLWSLKDRVKTVFIQSSEPWVPWELCRLTGMNGARKEEGPFFCEAFEMTRWLPGTGIKPQLHLSNMAVVVPESSGLPYSVPEMQYLLGLAGAKRKVARVPARYLSLVEAFASGKYDGWHFSGHGATRGADPNRSEMLLDQHETLTPVRINGSAANLGLAHPLVFLNACQIGAGGMSLTDIGGWARQFLSAGAGAFIGAHWAIYDRTSFFFAKELYTRLIAGQPVGSAVREARLAVRQAGDTTWLAYTVFAHPLATVQSNGQSA